MEFLTFITDNIALYKIDRGNELAIYINSEYLGMENVYIFVKSVNSEWLLQRLIVSAHSSCDNPITLLDSILENRLSPAVALLHKMHSALQ